MSQRVKIAPISITGNPKKSSIIDVFIAEPLANKELLAGKIFVLLESAKGKKNAEKINNFLIDRINYFFYENDKILLREKLSSLKPEHIFETALSKTNKALKSFLKSEKIKLEPGGISVTVGLAYQNEVHFSVFGKNKVFLVYKNKTNTDDEEYKLTDLSKQSERSEDNFFSNILSGQTPSRGGILICNEAMSEYLSNSQIKKIISTLPSRGAAEQIKNLLERINNYISFGGIIIKEGQVIKEKTEVEKPKIASYDSIQRLNTTESATEKILSPSGIFNLKNIINKFKKEKKNDLPPGTIVLKDKIYSKKRALTFSKRIISMSLTLLSYPINILYYIFKKIPKIKLINWDKIKIFFIKKVIQMVDFLKNGRLANKKIILISSFALIIIIFVINIFIGGKEQNEINQAENYDNLVTEIEKMQNHVEANLLYSNEEGAQELFEQINEKISTLPQETDEQIEKYKEFKKTLETQLNDVRRITIIESPKLIAELKNIDESANANSIMLLENSLYTSDEKNKSFYITNTSDNTITTLTDFNTGINSPFSPSITNSSIYYYNQGSVIELNVEEKKLKQLSFTADISNFDIAAIGTYSNRLYALSRQKNQILRFNRQNGSFGSAYSWLQEKADFANAIDIFIDGNIYVLFSNGDVVKFLRGQSQNFSLEKVQPPLESPSKISGSQDDGYLYVLEPDNKRLVVYDKKGQFVAQYKSETFSDLKDFYVNETNRTIYVLSANNIYEFSADFLE